MKISDQLTYIRERIDPWAKVNQGSGEISRNLIHWFSILSTPPGGFRYAIKFKGKDLRGQYEEAGLYDRKYWIGFSYGQSMQLEKGDALVKGQAGGRPLFDLVEELEAIGRGLQFDSRTTEVTPRYTGCHELTEAAPDWAMIDGFYLEFTIGCVDQNPQVQISEDNT